MKILYLTTTLSFAGAEQVILDLAQSTSGAIIAGLTSGNRELMHRAEDKRILSHSFEMKHKFDWTIGKKIRTFVEDNNIDLVHTHLAHANFLGRWALRRTSSPVVSSIHIIEKRFRPTHTLAEKWSAQWAEKIITVSPQVFEHAANDLRLPIEKLTCIPNGVDLTRFKERNQTRDIDILLMGRLDRQKGFDQLFPSLNEVAKNCNPKIVLAGSGPEEEKLKHLQKKYSLPIQWMGAVPDPEHWLARAKIVILPSRWEGFGLIAAEALASGAQVIHSGVDSLGAVCGDFGIPLPAQSSQWSSLIEKTLLNFTENPERHQWVRDHFSSERMVRAHHKLYDEVLCAELPE